MADPARQDPQPAPIRTPNQRIVVVLLGFLVPLVTLVLISQFAVRSGVPDSKSPGMSEEEIEKRIKPVGQLAVAAQPAAPEPAAAAPAEAPSPAAAPPAPPPAAPPPAAAAAAPAAPAPAPVGKITVRTGESIYKEVCSTCHEAGVAGAPKTGDKAAWEPRLAKGLDTLAESAIKGVGAMPPKGGKADLTDSDVALAVIYLTNKAGGAKAAPSKAAEKPAEAAPAKQAAAPAAPAAGGKGKSVFEANCGVCHIPGAAGAPKLGDKAVWAPRLKAGVDGLAQSATKGKGAMPPKGGNASLADADIKAAVEYMVSQAK